MLTYVSVALRATACIGTIVSMLFVQHAHAQLRFDNWHEEAELEAIYADFQRAEPSIVRIVDIGESERGLPIRAIKISDNVGNDEPDEGDVVFFGLMHAREWISMEMSLFLADHLIQNYRSDPAIRRYVDELEIWIVPVTNPDGFAFTQSDSPIPTSNRMPPRFWRKNQKRNDDGTVGVDLNRNWPSFWGRDSGSSAMPVADTYRGTEPFSEAETTSLVRFTDSLDNLKVLVSYHSFEPAWLRPWSFTDTRSTPGESILRAIALRSIEDIAAVNDTVYGDSLGDRGIASGETTDFYWASKRVAAFTPELGFGGFDPPEETIVPTVSENLPAALSLLRDAAERRIWIKDHPDDDGTEPSAVFVDGRWSRPFWQSPDISTVPETLEQGATVELNVRLRNDSDNAFSNVRVEFYYTDPRISVQFPNPDAIPIDTWEGTVPAGGRMVQVPWITPIGPNSWGERHWCVGVVIYHDTDLPLTTETRRTSNIASRNFYTTDAVATGTIMMIAATNFLDIDAELQYAVDEASLPPGWSAQLMLPANSNTGRAPQSSIERKGALLGATGPLLAAGETLAIPLRVSAPASAPRGASATVQVSGALIPLVAGIRVPVGNGFTYEVTKD